MAKRKNKKVTVSKAYVSFCFIALGIVILASLPYYLKKERDLLPFVMYGNTGELIAKNIELTLKYNLKSAVVGQDKPLRVIIDTLLAMIEEEIPTLMIFSGRVGVGKTMTTQIISSGRYFATKVVIADGLAEENLLSLLKLSTWSLLVVDDVNVSNLLPTIEIIRPLLFEAKKKNAKIAVIINYTLKNESDLKDLSDAVSDMTHVHVPFNPLNKEHVRYCFLKAMDKHQIEISEEELSALITMQMQDVDVIRNSPGCKSVDSMLVIYGNTGDLLANKIELTLKSNLQSAMVGQNKALSVIINSLLAIIKGEIPTLMIFSGRVGVGKTMTTQIISSGRYFATKVVIADGLAEENLLGLLKLSTWSLLVVDDANVSNFLPTIDIIRPLLFEAKRKNSKIVVIINYTLKNESEWEDISDAVSDITHVHVPFNPLNQEHSETLFSESYGQTLN